MSKYSDMLQQKVMEALGQKMKYMKNHYLCIQHSNYLYIT